MLLEPKLKTLTSFLTPGGKEEKVIHHLMGTSPSENSIDLKRFLNAKRALDGQLKGARNLTDKSWEDSIRIIAEDAGEDEIQIDEALESLQMHLKHLESIADSQGKIGKFPLGVLGYISAEILPDSEEFSWLKPTIDREIDLTVAFQKAMLSSEKITALARSDMAKTSTGQELLQAYTSANSEASKAIYASGLCVLTWFQILSAVVLGNNLKNADLKIIAGCADSKNGQKSSVDVWFHMLKSLTKSESWERIYKALAGIRGMDFDWPSKTGIGKLRKIRQGITPLPFKQASELIVMLGEELRNDKSTMVVLERAYRFSVIVDNFQRDWKKANAKSQLLPSLNLSNAFTIGYASLNQRNRGQ